MANTDMKFWNVKFVHVPDVNKNPKALEIHFTGISAPDKQLAARYALSLIQAQVGDIWHLSDVKEMA